MINGAEDVVALERTDRLQEKKSTPWYDMWQYIASRSALSNDCRRTAEDRWNERCQRHTKKFLQPEPDFGMLLCSETDEANESDEELVRPFPRWLEGRIYRYQALS